MEDDFLGELLWKEMICQGFKNDWGLEDAIVVADGSGSMYSYAAGQSKVTAIEVCASLAIYFAEQLNGVFHNKAITFSATPQFIELDRGKNLKEKLEIMASHCEIANTDIEAVFELLLTMALSHQVPPEELPKQVLIISDMEFDEAAQVGSYSEETGDIQTLFDGIERRFEEHGYHMPRLIFWNVCGRSNTIPMVNHENGLCLLSGFSQNAMKAASDREQKDPYQSLLGVLDGERYDPVERALESSGIDFPLVE